MILTIPLVIAIVLLVVGNAIAIFNANKAKAWPDPTFLIIDAAVVLYVLSAAGVH